MKTFKKKSKNKINTFGSRQYLYQGKVVATNRHKAMEQNTDSLQEFREAYWRCHRISTYSKTTSTAV